MLKIGFVGSGFISQFLAKSMLSVRDLELAGVLNRGGAEELASFARGQNLGDCQVYDSIRELCQNCDVIAIFAPNFARVEIVEQIADAVKSGVELTGVIAEKPLGRTVEEARRQVTLANECNLLTAYFENQVFMPAITNALQQLEPQQKAMGPLTLARAGEEHAGPHSSWFWDPRKQGGGVLSDMGCHSIAVGWYVLTPEGQPLDFLEPVAVSADTSLLKWGQPKYREKLKSNFGVDYEQFPAEDFATGIVTFRNPETEQRVKAQFTVSWMYDKQGLRLNLDALGPGYALEMNSLDSPSEIFIGDEAAEAIADSELALEKSTASRGLLTIQPNEADLYGYTGELVDMRDRFNEGRDATLSWEYGLQITRLVQAAYLAAERGETLDLTDPEVNEELESYKSLIAQGKGADILYP
ncbi:Gfo/Idh/MocA family oxidoreductase [Aliifodinibius sp. S!AR15-10]|uniref:Gfo/Idh/MocA family protein n=1 Tax=Aliifodinibius sp. S!AR15-10 TaxID=2950437 RepID=UPI002855094D|nr:Gfo/Idh/MocA family oxidoreductase [Aliifodinibius sp. S!AR15-10]MDR8389616.1 Gfo/Idh/MocA family oxidoreductase [Aliifodinibius sp. S!AR15-10]